MKLKDLVVLHHNDLNLEFISIGKAKKEYSGLEIDLEGESWSWGQIKNIPIGKKAGDLIVGIYNRSKIKDLNNILEDIAHPRRYFK